MISTVPARSAEGRFIVETEIEVPGNIVAPLSSADSIGTAYARLGVDTLASVPVFSAADIPAAGLISSTWDELLLWFE